MSDLWLFRVAYMDDVYRDIAMDPSSSLFQLGAFILEAFDFDMDQLFGFYEAEDEDSLLESTRKYELKDDVRAKQEDRILPPGEGLRSTSIAEAFNFGEALYFLFDEQEYWVFHVQCLKPHEPKPGFRYPRVIARIGESPEQYPEEDAESFWSNAGHFLEEGALDEDDDF